MNFRLMSLRRLLAVHGFKNNAVCRRCGKKDPRSRMVYYAAGFAITMRTSLISESELCGVIFCRRSFEAYLENPSE